MPRKPQLVVQVNELGSTGHASPQALAVQEARLVARDVAAKRAAKHGKLPPLTRREDPGEPDAWPSVTVENATPHRLVVMFAGPCPRTVALVPRAAHTAELCAGLYNVAAELSAPNFLPFVGDNEALENGYAYNVKFYVMKGPRSR